MSFPPPHVVTTAAVAAMDAATRACNDIAREARSDAAAINACEIELRRMATALSDLIGGSATDADKQLVQLIDGVSVHLRRAETALHAASRRAEGLAHDAAVRAADERRRLNQLDAARRRSP